MQNLHFHCCCPQVDVVYFLLFFNIRCNWALQKTTATANATAHAVSGVINVADGIENDGVRTLTKTVLVFPAAGVAAVGAVATTGAFVSDVVSTLRSWPFKWGLLKRLLFNGRSSSLFDLGPSDRVEEWDRRDRSSTFFNVFFSSSFAQSTSSQMSYPLRISKFCHFYSTAVHWWCDKYLKNASSNKG